MGVDPLCVNEQTPAGHIHLYAVAGDLALQGQNGYHRAGACTAGVGEIFHATLKCPLKDQVLAHDLVEIHIGAFGEGLVPPDGPTQLPQLVFIRLTQIGIGHHCVGIPGSPSST